VKKSLALFVAAAAMVIALAGCSTPSASPSSSPSDSTSAVTSTPDADDFQGGTQPGTLTPVIPFVAAPELDQYCPLDVPPAHLHQSADLVTGATVCGTKFDDDQLSTSTTTVSAVTGGLPELLEAYSVPNAPVEEGVMCTLQLEDPALVWVTYPGERSYPIYAPVDKCGFPTPEAAAAYSALTLQPIMSFTKNADGTITTTVIG
jgi:hypothetical protein